jgi:hypothetical protein
MAITTINSENSITLSFLFDKPVISVTSVKVTSVNGSLFFPVGTMAGSTVSVAIDGVSNKINNPTKSRDIYTVKTTVLCDDALSYTLIQRYIVVLSDTLIVGVNAVLGFDGYLLTALDMTHLRSALDATQEEFSSALISAYFNVGKLPLVVNKEWRDDLVISISESTTSDIDLYPAPFAAALRRAIVTEANFLLGDNPIEDRRRQGIISDSNGESAQFFRSKKPLQLATCAEAIEELSGFVRWSRSVRR